MDKRIIISIAGGSGCGKTTFAKQIYERISKSYSCEIISLDNFYLVNDNKIKNSTSKSVDVNFDIPTAIDWELFIDVVEKLLYFPTDKFISIPIYDFYTKKYKEWRKIKPVKVIIIEGLYSLYNQLINEKSSLNIFLEVSDDERLARRILRDIIERGSSVENTIQMWRDFVIPAHKKYIEPTKNNADIVAIQNNTNSDTLVNTISNSVKFHLQNWKVGEQSNEKNYKEKHEKKQNINIDKKKKNTKHKNNATTKK